MSKIYEALEQEEKRRKELQKPPVSKVAEPYVVERSVTPQMDQELIGLFYTIDSMLPKTTGRILEFVGSMEGEGTSTIVEDFGRIMAFELGKAVLILKTNGNLSDEFAGSTGNGNGNGTTDLERLTNGTPVREAFLKNGQACYFVCPVSAHTQSSFSVLMSPRIDQVFRELREHFDLILLDAPPVTDSSHALTICSKVDGIVMVIEAEKTRWPVAERVKERLVQAGGNVLGAILNKTRNHIPSIVSKRV